MSYYIKCIFQHLCRFVGILQLFALWLPSPAAPSCLHWSWGQNGFLSSDVLIVVTCSFLQDPLGLLWVRSVDISCICNPQPTGNGSLLLPQLYLGCQHVPARPEAQPLEMGLVHFLYLQRYSFLTLSLLLLETEGKISSNLKAVVFDAFDQRTQIGPYQSWKRKSLRKLEFLWMTSSNYLPSSPKQHFI
jgi:hypothetical protein